jgi:mannan endo-1,4-beta-mannosidase
MKYNSNKLINLTNIYIYLIRLSGQNDVSQTAFVQRWMWSHWEDATTILRKPLIFAEFDKSKKDPDYAENERDIFLNSVYTNIYSLARTGGGTMAGGLVWQVMAEGMDSYYDGYEIILPQDASTTALISKQSRVMKMLAQNMHTNAIRNTVTQVRDDSSDKAISKAHFQAHAYHHHHQHRHQHRNHHWRNVSKEQGQH